MIELSTERIEKILHEETAKKEELATILRGIYNRYMRLYEQYFSDIDALTDQKIGELKSFHEETQSLTKYYFMDIPQDICIKLNEFDKEYSADLLGPKWHEYLFDVYEEFKERREDEDLSEEALKKEFSRQLLSVFYDDMDYVFRSGFGTGSETARSVLSGIAELLFGEKG